MSTIDSRPTEMRLAINRLNDEFCGERGTRHESQRVARLREDVGTLVSHFDRAMSLLDDAMNYMEGVGHVSASPGTPEYKRQMAFSERLATWWHDVLELTGEHFVLTEEGWVPAEMNTREATGEDPMEVFDEINPPRVNA